MGCDYPFIPNFHSILKLGLFIAIYMYIYIYIFESFQTPFNQVFLEDIFGPKLRQFDLNKKHLNYTTRLKNIERIYHQKIYGKLLQTYLSL